MKRAVVVFVLLVVALGYYFGVFRLGQHHLRTLQTLQAADVDQVLLDGRQLPADRVPQFVSLVSDATLYSPNHPIHSWRVGVTILRRSPMSKISFPIYGCGSDGVQIPLYSWGGDSGWYYGTLRNDEIARFLREVAAIHPNQAMQPTGGPHTASFSMTKPRSFQITLGFAAGG